MFPHRQMDSTAQVQGNFSSGCDVAAAGRFYEGSYSLAVREMGAARGAEARCVESQAGARPPPSPTERAPAPPPPRPRRRPWTTPTMRGRHGGGGRRRHGCGAAPAGPVGRGGAGDSARTSASARARRRRRRQRKGQRRLCKQQRQRQQQQQQQRQRGRNRDGPRKEPNGRAGGGSAGGWDRGRALRRRPPDSGEPARAGTGSDSRQLWAPLEGDCLAADWRGGGKPRTAAAALSPATAAEPTALRAGGLPPQPHPLAPWSPDPRGAGRLFGAAFGDAYAAGGSLEWHGAGGPRGSGGTRGGSDEGREVEGAAADADAASDDAGSVGSAPAREAADGPALMHSARFSLSGTLTLCCSYRRRQSDP